ncbi:alpha/beta fold hydrolase [Dactylosporangium sp. NPDC049140]|uniref:alpha/beta fold hydrolase n=1 Tax=Dactylosporangium sp. NPDC049140 TaxID=3155647 RepID=UPI0033E0CEF4
MTIVTEGDPAAPAYVFLHGWPETPHCWREVMHLAAAEGNFAVALDLLDLTRRATSSHTTTAAANTIEASHTTAAANTIEASHTTAAANTIEASHTTAAANTIEASHTTAGNNTTANHNADAGNSIDASHTNTAGSGVSHDADAGNSTNASHATDSTDANESAAGTKAAPANETKADPAGGTNGAQAAGTKAALAAAVREALQPLGLSDITLVGHDCGGMVTFAYLRAYGQELRRAVIMNTVVPGVEPWEEVRRNPYIWHFGLHAVPGLPELLVRGHERAYFDYFYDILSPEPSAVPDEARAVYAAAYAAPGALEAGFSWYRAFPADAAANAGAVDVRTPLLYLRGEFEGGDIAAYAAGLRAAGVRDVATGVIEGAGHFAPDQAPAEVWRLITER